ncbi:hypothetical protein [uncultured Treponema sp.]|uniref:hypothetical protein n=1 Tax=uncultured Treponema sp. TaxID=162155 RepID=UPI0025EEF267|nr:hypothetical protein [uncultured Treponema sp.]
MKKIIATLVALAAISTVAFADEGLKVSGRVRAGITDTTEGSVYTTDAWMNGGYFGGATQLRVNVDYTKAFGGITARYNVNDFTNGKFFNDGNVKWVMGYANFADGQVITEAGIIHDRFTTTGGWEDAGIDGGKGIRVVFAPKAVEGLTFAVQATDLFAEKYTATDDKVKDKKANAGDVIFNAKLIGATAKYETKEFFATAGFAVAGFFYGSVGVTAVDGLTFVAEVFHDNTDDTKAKPENNDKAVTTICLWGEYTGIDQVLLGAYSYIYLNDGEYTAEVTPAVSFDLTKVVTLSAEASFYLSSVKDFDSYAVITPAVTFKASDKASANVSASISTDKDQEKHSITAGVLYKF